ncbi:hypothetical protein JANAI62_01810 [Jannaschia pagri]|uniref:DUF2927 domain-containing protein n=1 Tax=Jannaschia pagri TaxID=2829797 RepID=A0ABQ4NGL2_9RHOB|nr:MULTISPECIES: DUF2927 domain-containing protein [unclassified Jannaschia]GIT90336.1 hypothetical protein JANAI61_07940 [Jannaschia sp. AI_61]GIT93558.1 hypothetical protein JANAI62_01810 [Jannaschia sp. AI_62]
MIDRLVLCGAVAGLLAACQPTAVAPPVAPSPVPTARPAIAPPAPEAVPPSRASISAALFYRRLEQRLLTEGLLRTDGGGPDTAFGPDTLARNFERIALFSEYVQVGGRYVAQQSRAQLRRWAVPVRVQLHFGASVSADRRAQDSATVRSYVARLRRVSGHPINVVNSGGNYHLFIVNLDEQRTLGPQISAAEPGLSRSTVAEITGLGKSTYCAVYASSTSANPNTYVSAISLIRTEHPDLMRQACYHEEIAQGLGLANDSPAVRPSIFNDDEEFALLTRHDELLLRILYDRRLSVGMTADEARPIVQQIARELVSGRL